jgi:hypothetical protein
MEKKYGYITALSLFKALYEEQKGHNIYQLIEKFILIVIKRRNIIKFTRNEISQFLKEDFGFDIPNAVIKMSLRNRDLFHLEHQEYVYLTENEPEWVSSIETKYTNTMKSNELVLERIRAFIIEETGKEKTLEEINILLEGLLIKNETGSYSDILSKYIILNKNNNDIMEILDSIKAGYIIYNGLKYSSPSDNIHKNFNNSINLYFTTEMLFSFYGYNGELFKNIFMEFFDLVTNVNQKSKKGKIFNFYYFENTKNEINAYFEKAKAIKRNEDNIDHSKTAMVEICSKCKNESDIVIEKNKFIKALELNRFILYNQSDFYDKENHQHNILDINDSDRLCKSVGLNIKDENTYNNLSLLNYINILRKGKQFNSFELCEHVLVTSANSTLKLALSSELKCNGNFPLATNLEYITNRLWIKQNKGFSKNSQFASYHAITSAQIVLSSLITNKIGGIYEEVYKKVRNGEIDEDIANKTIAEFKSHLLKPEQIDETVIDQVCLTITDASLEKQIEIMEDRDRQFENLRATKLNLEKIVENKDKQLQDLKNNEIEHTSDIEKLKQTIQNQSKMINTMTTQIDSINDRENKKIEFLKRVKKNIIKLTIIFIYFLVFYGVYKAYINSNIKIMAILSAVAIITPITPFVLKKIKI